MEKGGREGERSSLEGEKEGFFWREEYLYS